MLSRSSCDLSEAVQSMAKNILLDYSFSCTETSMHLKVQEVVSTKHKEPFPPAFGDIHVFCENTSHNLHTSIVVSRGFSPSD
jgi:hypothetical protein